MEFDESVSTSQAQAAGLGSSGFSDNSDPSLGDDDYTVTGTPTEFRTLQNYNQARGASSTNPFPESFFSQLFGPDNVNYTNILGSNRINEINNLRYNQATGGMSNRTGANTGKPYQMGDYYIGQPTQMGTVSEVPQTGIMSVMNNLPVIGGTGAGADTAIIDNYNGYIVNSKNIDSISDAIKKVLNNDEIYYKMVDNCKTKLSKDHNPKINGNIFGKFVKKITT